MTTLPHLYARFRPLFAKMDLPLRSALEGILASFATIPPPNTADERQITGEFVGFDGIENRGRLSNLLESEWLSRELDPDDFVRRVAEGEVMFRRRDFMGTGAKDVLCVVLDCGPWMLGRHRIIALAALFYLALRADRISARLMWTVPGIAKGWSEGLTPENIRIFLGRVVQEPLPIAAMDAALEGFETDPKEYWYVGSAHTKDLSLHPNVTGSIIAQTHYGADTVDVKVTSQGRRSTLSITPAPDADIVAALRRPFVPERSKAAPIAQDVDDLTAHPFHSDWLLDRFNQAVLIRYPEGALWYPFRKETNPTWLAVPKGKALLGLQPQTDGKLSVLLGLTTTVAELLTVDVSQNPASVISGVTGHFNREIGPQPAHAMGNLHVTLGGQCLLVAADGITHTLVQDGLSAQLETDDRAVLSDGIYLIELANGALRVKNPRRGVLARAPLEPAHRDLFREPRRTVFSPDTKAITFTTDGVQHVTYQGPEVTRFDLEGMSLLYLHNAARALAWDAAKNSLVPFQWIDGRLRKTKGAAWAIKTPITGRPRYCPLTQTVFAMNTDDAGTPAQFVPLDTKRGWQTAEPFDIPDAIERAVTLWL